MACMSALIFSVSFLKPHKEFLLSLHSYNNKPIGWIELRTTAKTQRATLAKDADFCFAI